MPTLMSSIPGPCHHLRSGKVLTLIVTYEGAETVRQTIESCISSFHTVAGPVLVIDNASKDDTVSRVTSVSFPGLEIVSLRENLGVAKAYNMGIEKAEKIGAEWLFILDQDTACGPCCVGLLLKTAGHLMERGEKVGAVCPTAKSRRFPANIHPPYVWTGRGLVPVNGLKSGLSGGPAAIDSSMTSGTLYRVEALASVNGFREEYFIDFVDHECHIRLRQAGWSVWLDNRAEIYHRLGKIERITDEGLWIEHEPFRYYYMMRNMIEGNWRLGGLRPLVFFGVDACRHIQRLRRYAEAPDKCIRYILKGVWDAVWGRSGRLDSDD